MPAALIVAEIYLHILQTYQEFWRATLVCEHQWLTSMSLAQEAAEDGSTVVVSTQGPLCFANAQRIKERLIQFSVRACPSVPSLQPAALLLAGPERSLPCLDSRGVGWGGKSLRGGSGCFHVQYIHLILTAH